jgi:hypothetical protein
MGDRKRMINLPGICFREWDKVIFSRIYSAVTSTPGRPDVKGYIVSTSFAGTSKKS